MIKHTIFQKPMWHDAQTRVEIKWQKIIFIIIILVNIAFNSSYISAPFIGQNSWRDSQTFGVCRNFIEEDNNILEPAYDIRKYNNEGELPGEFPLFSYYTSVLMRVFGIDISVARFGNYLLFLASSVLLFLLCNKKFDSYTALFVVAAFVSNPLVSSQSISTMPETMVNFFVILTLFFFFNIENRALKWTFIIIAVCLATLIKPSGFVILSFILTYDLISSEFSLKNWLYYVFLSTIPVVLLVLWIHHTLTFEQLFFGNTISHEYNHTVAKAWRELTFETTFSAFEKTFRHGLNVVGVTCFLIVILKLFKIQNLFNSKNAWPLGAILYLGGGIFFLLYASGIQHTQLYYAASIIVPGILFCAYSFQNGGRIVCFTLSLLLLLQTNIKVNTFLSNFEVEREKWNNFRLEKSTEKFSNRNDLFIVYPFPYSDFTQMGRLGRRGLNLQNITQLDSMKYGFSYLCLLDTNKRHEIMPYVSPMAVFVDSQAEYYAIR